MSKPSDRSFPVSEKHRKKTYGLGLWPHGRVLVCLGLVVDSVPEKKKNERRKEREEGQEGRELPMRPVLSVLTCFLAFLAQQRLALPDSRNA